MHQDPVHIPPIKFAQSFSCLMPAAAATTYTGSSHVQIWSWNNLRNHHLHVIHPKQGNILLAKVNVVLLEHHSSCTDTSWSSPPSDLLCITLWFQNLHQSVQNVHTQACLKEIFSCLSSLSARESLLFEISFLQQKTNSASDTLLCASNSELRYHETPPPPSVHPQDTDWLVFHPAAQPSTHRGIVI